MALKLEHLRQAEYRHAQFYLHQLEALNRRYLQGGEHTTQAIREFEALWAQIQQGHSWSVAHRDDALAAALCGSFPDAGAQILGIRQNLPDRIDWLEQGLQAAEHLEDIALMTGLRLILTGVYSEAGRLEAAVTHGNRAVEDARAQDDHLTAARALMTLGHTYNRLGDNAAARACYAECLALARQLNNPVGIATSLNNLGTIATREGDYHTARDCLEECLSIHLQMGVLGAIAGSLNNYGLVLWALDELEAAQAAFEESATLRRTLGDMSGLASTLNNLGAITGARKQFAAARDHLTQALTIARGSQHRPMEAAVLTTLGTVARDAGDDETALRHYTASRAILTEIRHPFPLCECVLNTSFVHIQRGDAASARTELQSALSIAHEIDTVPLLLWAIIGYAYLRLLANDAKSAAHYAGLVNASRNRLEFRVREHLNDLRAQLEQVLSPDDLQSAFDTGAALDLETVIQDLLNG